MPCRDENPVLSGVSAFGCATGLGKDETSGETASEGTAVDTGDILGVFAREARTDLAPRGAMKKTVFEKLVFERSGCSQLCIVSLISAKDLSKREKCCRLQSTV